MNRASDELLRALSRSAVAETLGEVSFRSHCDVTLQGLRHLGAFPKLRYLLASNAFDLHHYAHD
jgi:hypothetical protein